MKGQDVCIKLKLRASSNSTIFTEQIDMTRKASSFSQLRPTFYTTEQAAEMGFLITIKKISLAVTLPAAFHVNYCTH